MSYTLKSINNNLCIVCIKQNNTRQKYIYFIVCVSFGGKIKLCVLHCREQGKSLLQGVLSLTGAVMSSAVALDLQFLLSYIRPD